MPIRLFAPAPERLDRLRPMGVLIIFGGLVGPVISALVIAAVLAKTDSRTDFVLTVFALTLIRSFAAITLVPLMIQVVTWFRSRSHEVRRMRAAEACLLFICLAISGAVAFLSQTSGSTYSSVFLYAPTAILVWAATRFGVTGTCTSTLFLGAVAIWSMSTGSSSFSREMITERELSLLSFLVATCGPLLLLSATLRDRTVLYGQNALSEARFNSILSLDAAPMVVWHEDSYVAEANSAFLALTGYDQADLGNHSIPLTGLFSDADRAMGRANSAATLTNWGPQEEELQAKDGRRIPVTTGGLRIPYANGQGVAYFFDLSRSRIAQSQFREAELLHTAVLASLHDQIVVLDRDGVIIEANESWRRIVEPTTIAPTERLQVRDHYLHAFKESSGNALVSDLLEGVRKVLSGLSTRHRLEFPVDSPDGPVWFEISIEPLRRPEGGAVVTRTEITERKRAMTQASEQRQQLAHLSRAAVLGELSGAFAHELNQPLTSILGNAEAALQLLTQGSENLGEIRDIMRDIIRDDIRAADVIQRLRSMLARGEINREPVDLNQVGARHARACPQ
ncbi:MAG: PAS domain S-box protein [Steroidobacteraceae bacterium]